MGYWLYDAYSDKKPVDMFMFRNWKQLMEEAEIGALAKLGDTDKYGSLRSPKSGSSGSPRVTMRSSELGPEKVD